MKILTFKQYLQLSYKDLYLLVDLDNKKFYKINPYRDKIPSKGNWLYCHYLSDGMLKTRKQYRNKRLHGLCIRNYAHYQDHTVYSHGSIISSKFIKKDK